MPRVSRIQFISRRVARLKETLQVDTQKIREKLLNNLQMIFDNAVVLARGDVTVDGEELTLNERRDWTRVAAYTAQIIQSIAKGFDERQIDVMLDELEKLVAEAKAKATIKH